MAPVTAGEVSVAWRVARVLLIMAAMAAAVVVAVIAGAITLPGVQSANRSSQAGGQAALAANQTAADERWASGTCTDILDWKNEIRRDETSLDLGFGPLARIQDAIAATTRMLGRLDALGLPPGAHTPQARAEIAGLRSGIESRLRSIEGAAASVASGNFGQTGALLSDVEGERVLAAQTGSELRHVLSVDLGLSLVETRACRQLVGIPI